MGVSEVVSHRYTERKDELAAAQQAAAEKQHQDEMTRVQADTANANERAATLEKEAAQLQLDLERERAARVPRTINPEQRAAVLALLKSGPKGIVRMRPKMWDPEAEGFSKQIAGVLREAGFDVKDESTVSYGILGAFLVIRDANHRPPHFEFIHDCFKTIGIDLPAYAEEYVPDTESVVIGVSSHP